MKQRRDIFKFMRIYKTVSLYVTLGIAFAVFLVLYLNSDLRNYIYSDQKLFTLCFLTWLVLLLNFVISLFDFISLKNVAEVGHNLNQIAYLDKLTGIPNRYSCDLIFQTMMDDPEKVKHVGCFLLSISNLMQVNDEKGHEAGDQMITVFSSILDSVGSKYGFVGRNSGNEFLLVIENCAQGTVDAFLAAFKKRIANHNVLNEDAPIHVSYVCLLNESAGAAHFSELITNLYDRFHEAPEELDV